jgi:hypothetical protein
MVQQQQQQQQLVEMLGAASSAVQWCQPRLLLHPWSHTKNR